MWDIKILNLKNTFFKFLLILHMFNLIKKCLKMPKRSSESVNQKMTENTIGKRKRTEGQTIIYKILQYTLKD